MMLGRERTEHGAHCLILWDGNVGALQEAFALLSADKVDVEKWTKHVLQEDVAGRALFALCVFGLSISLAEHIGPARGSLAIHAGDRHALQSDGQGLCPPSTQTQSST